MIDVCLEYCVMLIVCIIHGRRVEVRGTGTSSVIVHAEPSIWSARIKVIGVITEACGAVDQHDLGAEQGIRCNQSLIILPPLYPYNQECDNLQRQALFFNLPTENKMGASCPPATPVALQPPPLRQPFPCASSLHPAFFTDRLRRAPATLAVGSLVSPVTQGYVYQESERRKPKL